MTKQEFIPDCDDNGHGFGKTGETGDTFDENDFFYTNRRGITSREELLPEPGLQSR